MSRIHAFIGIALVAVLLGLAGLAAPARAQAAEVAPAAALSVSAHCDSTGGGTFICDAFPSGGVSPYRYTWTPGANATITQNYGDTVMGQCVIGKIISMKVTVKDSLGATASATTGFKCTSVAP